MTVHILDVNDNQPQFENSSYSAQIAENSPTGTTFIQLQVRQPLWLAVYKKYLKYQWDWLVSCSDSVHVSNLVLCRQQTWILEFLVKSHIQLGEGMEGTYM